MGGGDNAVQCSIDLLVRFLKPISACLEQIASPETLAKFGCGKDEDAVLGAAALAFQADDHAPPDPRMVLPQGAQALEMIGCNFDRRLCFDGDLHIVHNEVHLDAAGQAPVAQGSESLRVGVVGAQLVEDPVLESLAVKLRARSQLDRKSVV